MYCFTFSIEDLANLKDLVSDYRKFTLIHKECPQINDVPFQVTLKAPVLYNNAFANPDCVLTFMSHGNGIYNIHYETANALLLNIEGFQKPFDFTIEMNRTSKDGKRYTITKKPSNFDLQFLKSNYKFGVKNSNADVFILACQSAQFILGALSPIIQGKKIGDNIYYSFVPNYVEVGKEYIKFKQIECRKTNLLEGWDIVTLTDKQLMKVAQTNEEHHLEYDTINIPLPRFCLSLYNNEIKATEYFFFEKVGKRIRCGVTDIENYITKWFDVVLGLTEGNGVHADLHADTSDKSLSEWLENNDNWEWCANTFFLINTFMLNYADVTMEVETKIANESTQSNHKKHNQRNVSRLFKSYKLIKNWKSQARKKAEITCPCWGVRGHYRHYKNGKVVFIEPFIKGKEKDAYKGKEYALLPYKDA